MTALLALLAELLHCALMLAAAPTLLGLLRWTEARLARRRGPHPLQPWRDLARLLRKHATLAENASPMFLAVPIASLAATAVTVLLVPSFTLGMAFGRFSDLLVLGGLLALPRMLRSLAALDAGTGSGGATAARAMSLTVLAEPAMFLVILTLGMLSGTTNLDLLISVQHGGMLQPGGASALLAAALVAIGLGTSEPLDGLAEYGGVDLAALTLAEGFRLLVWLDLIGAVFLPLGMSPAYAGPVGWSVGVLAWAVRVAVLTGMLSVFRHVGGHIRRVPLLLAAASLLGLLATALAIASAAAI
ncbi:MAG TPA: NADH-quinone oxidoreductase subunit H [Acetobacteraceae bacterium]|jgi:formate hydrogenlyase subunit 4